MNPKKHPTELKPSIFASKRMSGKLPWSKLFCENVMELRNPRLSAEAVRTWLLLQPVLFRSERPGYLIENGKPMGLESLSNEIWKPVEELECELPELLKFKLLKKEGKLLFDPWMVSDQKARAERQTSSNDDGSLGEGTAQTSQSRVEESRGDHIDSTRLLADSDIAAAVAGGSSLTGSTQGASSSDQQVTTSGNQTNTSGSSKADQWIVAHQPDIERWENEFAAKGLDVRGSVRKCVEYNLGRGKSLSDITPEWVERWLKMEKPGKGKKPAKREKKQAKADRGKNGRAEEPGKTEGEQLLAELNAIGESLRTLEPKTREEIEEVLDAKGFDPEQTFDCFYEGGYRGVKRALKQIPDTDTYCGIDYWDMEQKRRENELVTEWAQKCRSMCVISRRGFEYMMECGGVERASIDVVFNRLTGITEGGPVVLVHLCGTDYRGIDYKEAEPAL
jgi:hypothetical protein